MAIGGQQSPPNLSGYYANIQRGVERRGEIEASKPNKYTAMNQTLQMVKPIFEHVLLRKVDEHFSNKNKVQVTPELIDQFAQEAQLSPETKNRLMQYQGIHIDPNQWDKLTQETVAETRYQAAIEGMLGDQYDKEELKFLKSLPREQGVKFVLESMKEKAKKAAISGLPEDEQAIASLDPGTYVKGKLKVGEEKRETKTKTDDYIFKMGMEALNNGEQVPESIRDSFSEIARKRGYILNKEDEGGWLNKKRDVLEPISMKLQEYRINQERVRKAIDKGLTTPALGLKLLKERYGPSATLE